MNLWLTDPTTSKKSVSLTLMVLSFFGCIVGGGLQIAGKTETVSICLELFYGCSALYFGRRFSMNGKTFDASSLPTPVATVVTGTITLPPTNTKQGS